MTDITPEQLRLKLLENGYTPLPNRDKACYLKGWPDIEVTPEVIHMWSRKHRRFDATGLRIQDYLVPIDFDINDAAAMEVVVDYVDRAVPGLSTDALVRFGKGAKECWFVRCEETFGRIHGRGWTQPGDGIDGTVHRVEIFGGASPRQFGCFGAHSRDADGNPIVSYQWQGESPLVRPLASLRGVTKTELFKVVTATEDALKSIRWNPVLLSSVGQNEPERIYDLTDAMQFDLLDGRRLSLSELRAAAASEEGLRCSASWLEGPSAVNRSRCLVSLSRSGSVSIWETAAGQTHLEASHAPVAPLKGHDDIFDRAAEKLRQLQDARKFKVRGDDDAMTAAGKLLETTAFCPSLRNSVVPIWTDDADAGITMQAFRTLMMPNITEEQGPRGGRVVINPVDLWASSGRRVTVQGLRLRPDQPRPLYEDAKGRWINIYDPPVLDAGGGDATLGLDFLKRLIPDELEHRYFLQWLAYKLTHPAIPGPAIIMVARQFGVGRGTLALILSKLFGPKYVKTIPFHIISGKSQQSQYNDWGASALIAVINESSETEGSVYVARRNAYEHLKELIEPNVVTRHYVRKGERNFDAPSFTSIVIMTNHTDAISVPKDDRRCFVVTNGEPQPAGYYERLHAWIENDANIGAFAEALRAVDLSDYSPFVAPPLTDGKVAMADATSTDLDRAFDAALAGMQFDVFVCDQLINAMREVSRVHGFDLPDRWQHVVKRLLHSKAWRVGIRDGRNWSPQINGRSYAVYARTSAAAKKWTNVEADALRREVIRNGNPSGSDLPGNVLPLRQHKHGEQQ